MPTPKRPPAFQFYPDAWLGSVSVETMPPEVEGTYIRLLARQWLAVSLPANPTQLRLLTKLTPPQWKKAWPLLEPHFPLVDNGAARRNPTLAAVHAEREAYLAESAERGRQGAEKRWGGQADAKPTPSRPAKGTPSKKHRGPIGDPMPTPIGEASKPQWGSDDSGSVSGTDIPPTAADAAVSPPRGAAAAAAAPSMPDPAAFARHEAAVRERFTDQRHVLAFDRHLRAAQFPDVLLLDLEAAARERPSDGAPGVPWDVIGTVLHELSVKGKRPTEHLVRVFAEPMLNPRAPGRPTPPGAQTEAEIEAEFMRRIEAGEFLPPELREVSS